MSKLFILQGDGYEFGVFGDSRISLLDIAKLVWPNKKNYYNIVRKKAIDQAYQDADLHRVGMMSDSIFVDVTKLRAILTRLSHREKLAKKQLLEFDFSFIPKALEQMHEKLLDAQIRDTEAALEKLKYDRQLVPEKYGSIAI